MDSVWVFNGNNSSFPAGVFLSKQEVDKFVKKYNLSGCATRYPVGQSLYDWSVEKEYFVPKKDYQKFPKFIETFSSASAEHYHYEKGSCFE